MTGLPPLLAGGLNATETAPADGVELVTVGAPGTVGATHCRLNVPMEPPFPSTAIRYVVPATALNVACVAPLATDVSAPRLVPV